MEIIDRKLLEDAVRCVVTDYNDRSHVSLLGRTPNEANEDVHMNWSEIKQNWSKQDKIENFTTKATIAINVKAR